MRFDPPRAQGAQAEAVPGEAAPTEGAQAERHPAEGARADGAPGEARAGNRQRAIGDVRRRRSGEERPPLPKRVRQQNLAAQLRDGEAAAGPASGADEAPVHSRRTPEEARAMMSSIQRGTRRGRAEVEDGEDSG
ncbi:hypothetical protein BJF79_36500 [Actinomadura sp. CNU-125]|uniref:hypothetical protein n=1 Tax=Actinomadura sp. CNU-125 TaxID=1904961 RepID=UPI00095A042B|nr:hypothetical protein [Actinomadura sp. CNU-125]OLT32004.1 hypothetical protein BJF79_36500 [Actinomadura sp. CNU-125]